MIQNPALIVLAVLALALAAGCGDDSDYAGKPPADAVEEVDPRLSRDEYVKRMDEICAKGSQRVGSYEAIGPPESLQGFHQRYLRYQRQIEAETSSKRAKAIEAERDRFVEGYGFKECGR